MSITIKRPNLTNYQRDLLYCDSRFTICEASTKVGKTFSHIWWIFELAHSSDNKAGYNFWWVAPVYSQTKIAFNRIRSKIGRTGAYKINESSLTIVTPIGTIIHFKSAEKPDNLFGEDVYGIVFDEAPRARVESFYALRSTITATGGKMKMIGNFGGSSNWMHQLKEKSKNDSTYSYHKITAWDAVEAGILQREEIEQAQRDLPPKVFRSLYLAEEQESDNMLVTYDSIKDLFTNTHVASGDSQTTYISCDIALHGSDNFILYTWRGFTIVDCVCINKIEANEVEALIRSKANEYKVKRSNIVYDADGLGSYLRGYLSGAKPFNNGGKPVSGKSNVNYKNLKSQCGYKLADYINKGLIYIDCDIDRGQLTKELECLQSYDLDKDGKIQLMPKSKIKEIIGNSPDYLDALIMRMYFEIIPRGKKRTNLGEAW